MNKNTTTQSHIRGVGHGSDHIWIHQGTKQLSTYYDPTHESRIKDKQSNYRCQKCGTCFCHYYDMIPDIFIAIKNAGIPNKCGTDEDDKFLLSHINDKFTEIEEFIIKALPDPVIRKHFLRNLLLDLECS